jgi:hypothetical protein
MRIVDCFKTDLDKCFKVEVKHYNFPITPMIKWIDENSKHDWTCKYTNHPVIDFYFVDENDAMMFKLSL